MRQFFFALAVLVVATLSMAMSAGPALLSTEYHLRVNCGGPEVRDADGKVWLADKRIAKGGKPFAFPAEKLTAGVVGAAPEEVYRSVRHQNHALVFTDIPAGHYRVRLHLVDAFPNHERRMDFHAQGKIVLDDINPYEIAGKKVNRVVVREFPVVVESDKKLVIHCQQDQGDDVFEAAVEIIAKDAPRPPHYSSPVAGEDSASSDHQGRRKEMLEVTSDRPVRLAWVQTDNAADLLVTKGQGVQLKGYDTAMDAKGERTLIDAGYPIQKPMFTHDGSRVVFSNPSTGRCHVIDWDGSDLRDLGSGFAADVWEDPETGIEWVYVAMTDPEDGLAYVRRQLDDQAQEEKVWAGLPPGEQIPWLQLSADGSRAAEAFPWPKCGVVKLGSAGFDWNLIGNGCWPGLAPDNSYRFFLFQGDHTTISLVEEGDRAGRPLAINTIPDLDGKRVYHPRWSNNARYLTVTGPQKSEASELYLGRFCAEFSRIEAWVRVTLNGRADFYGDAWIAPES